MKQVFAETIGKARIAIVQRGGDYAGAVWRDGKQTESLTGSDLEKLKAQLRNAAGKLHPDYYGIDGAKARFLRFFPDGFADPSYLTRERNYKLKARDALLAAAPLEQACDADLALAGGCRKGLATNLLSPFEAARLNEVLGSSDGPAFLRSAAGFTQEPGQHSLDAMVRAISPHGAATWPLLTYLSYLWRPDTHMFLKPEATLDFATRVGHDFAREYDSKRRLGVYDGLIRLAAWTEDRIADLSPADRIDVQSFIWVVGSYTDEDA